jgi:hypothetical protein
MGLSVLGGSGWACQCWMGLSVLGGSRWACQCWVAVDGPVSAGWQWMGLSVLDGPVSAGWQWSGRTCLPNPFWQCLSLFDYVPLLPLIQILPLLQGSVAKKPYNPIIGEHFHCSWDVSREALSEASRPMNGEVWTSDGPVRLAYCAEQVSHHPPSKSEITCCVLFIKLAHTGYNAVVNVDSDPAPGQAFNTNSIL